MKQVPLDNDWEFEYYLSRKNSATGLDEPVPGMSGLHGKFSAVDGGAAIDAAVDITLTERSGAPGHYFGILDGDVMRTKMGSLSRAFEVFGDGVNVLYSEPVAIVQVRHK